MNEELEKLLAQIKANEDAEDAALLLINGFADRLKAAQGDPAKIEAIIAEMKTHAEPLAAAVVANTAAESD